MSGESGAVTRQKHSRVTIHHSPLQIEGYASLWGVADLNGDVVQAGAFADSLAKTGSAGVRMLNQHDARAPVGVWEQIVEDARGLFVRGRIEDWSAEARFAPGRGVGRAVDRLPHGAGPASGTASRAERGRALGSVAGDVPDAAGGAVQFGLRVGQRLGDDDGRRRIRGLSAILARHDTHGHCAPGVGSSGMKEQSKHGASLSDLELGSEVGAARPSQFQFGLRAWKAPLRSRVSARAAIWARPFLPWM